MGVFTQTAHHDPLDFRKFIGRALMLVLLAPHHIRVQAAATNLFADFINQQ
jgi:hypothetical protein